MTAEYHDPTHESVLLIEDLFDKLETRAEKEGGRAWALRRQQRIVANKALYFYTLPDAEALITEYLQQVPDEDMTDEELDAETSLDELDKCRLVEVQFTAQREADEDNNNEISTTYVVELTTASALEGISGVPSSIQNKVQAELERSYREHDDRLHSKDGIAGDEDDDEDFNADINFVKRHVFEMDEVKESMKYSIVETYDGDDFSVPFSSYFPDQIASLDRAPQVDAREDDEMTRLFDELIGAQDMKTLNPEIPKNIRVAQVLAILSLLEFGETQNEEEQRIIEDMA